MLQNYDYYVTIVLQKITSFLAFLSWLIRGDNTKSQFLVLRITFQILGFKIVNDYRRFTTERY